MKSKSEMPVKTIERLALYRSVLRNLQSEGAKYIFSHDLAAFTNNSSPQVRRDLMLINYTGNSRKGYSINGLIDSITVIFSDSADQKIALIGVGNLGNAILSYFRFKQSKLEIVAAFESDKSKVGSDILGCPCFHLSELMKVVEEKKISLGIITTPAQYAQSIAEKMVDSGITGILNFAPVPLRLPKHIFIEQIDITLALEKIAFFAG